MFMLCLAEQEKTMAALEALTGLGIGQAPVDAPSIENALGADSPNESTAGAGLSNDKSGGKKKRKGKGKK